MGDGGKKLSPSSGRAMKVKTDVFIILIENASISIKNHVDECGDVFDVDIAVLINIIGRMIGLS